MLKFKWFILCFILAFSVSADALKCASEFNTASSSRKWMSFNEAKDLIQNQGIKTKREFQEWSKSKKRPKNFPSNPNQVYTNEWKGWGDFLGTGNISTGKRKWMSFQDAKTLMQSQGIKTHKDFIEWKKDGKRPKDFPSNPNQIYKDKWKGWGDFLDTGNISNRKMEWMSFQDAKTLMQSQGIKTNREFIEWKKAGKRPEDFPSNPQRTYKKEWISWSHFLGNEKQWMSFDQAKTFIQRQGIRTSIEFREWSKSKKDLKTFQAPLTNFTKKNGRTGRIS